MMFDHNFVKFERPLESAHTKDGHYYKHKVTGKTYVSITTIFKLLDPKDWYEYWVKSEMKKQNIDEESAIKWCKSCGEESMRVGTRLHTLAESYLLNESCPPPDTSTYEKSPKELFRSLKTWLDDNIQQVNATECKIHSDELNLAGTVDLVATLKTGEKVIIDFKNSRKPKTPSKIKSSHYYEQMCAYAKMWECSTGEKIETGIVVVVSWDGKVRPFRVKLSDYESSLLDWIIKYEALNP